MNCLLGRTYSVKCTSNTGKIIKFNIKEFVQLVLSNFDATQALKA